MERYHSPYIFYILADALILTLDYPMLMYKQNHVEVARVIIKYNCQLKFSQEPTLPPNFIFKGFAAQAWAMLNGTQRGYAEELVFQFDTIINVSQSIDQIMESNSLSSALFLYLFTSIHPASACQTQS